MSTKRPGSVRPNGRAARVAERVLTATAEELASVGYGALRIEDVAERSGVHKTTIYRRWVTKEELVAATISTLIAQGYERAAIDTGTIRGDLRASLALVLELTPSQQGILRVIQVERAMPEVEALAHRFSDELYRMRVAMVKRGVARGELPTGVDANLIVDLVSAPVQKALLFGESVSASYLDRVVDVVLAGAAACASAPVPRSPARRAGKRAAKPRSRAK